MKILIRISEDGRLACVFDFETGKADVVSAVALNYMNFIRIQTPIYPKAF
jgi:hypothetical protein